MKDKELRNCLDCEIEEIGSYGGTTRLASHKIDNICKTLKQKVELDRFEQLEKKVNSLYAHLGLEFVNAKSEPKFDEIRKRKKGGKKTKMFYWPTI